MKYLVSLLPGLSLVFLMSGCGSVFHESVILSTKAEAACNAKAIKPVRVERCDYEILMVHYRSDSRDPFDEILEKAKKEGGNAVINLQKRGTKMLYIVPFYGRECYEIVGEAALIE